MSTIANNRIYRTKAGRRAAVKTDGFASKREALRFYELQFMERVGKITALRNNRDHKDECTFVLIPAQYIQAVGEKPKCVERACTYIADFVYVERERPALLVVEDTKGYREDVYRIKKKLLLRVHGIQVREI